LVEVAVAASFPGGAMHATGVVRMIRWLPIVAVVVVVVGGGTGAADTVNSGLLCAVEPAKLVAVTRHAYCPAELAVIELDVAPEIGPPFRVQL
jgi:hypothetical protein